MILPASFYEHSDVAFLAKSLLGKYLCTQINGYLTAGMICETEGYSGTDDKACHAYGNRRTTRTEIMYAKGGAVYVYLCYGMHNLFNVITSKKDDPQAVLIRALMPTDGIMHMEKRRNTKKNLTSGPGNVCKALGINRKHTGHFLNKPPIWIEDRNAKIHPNNIITTTRIGIAYAGEDARLPLRFLLAKHV